MLLRRYSRRSMRMWVVQNLLYLHRIRMQEETEKWDDILLLMRKVTLPLNLTLASNMKCTNRKGRASIAKRSDAGCQSFIPPLTLLLSVCVLIHPPPATYCFPFTRVLAPGGLLLVACSLIRAFYSLVFERAVGIKPPARAVHTGCDADLPSL